MKTIRKNAVTIIIGIASLFGLGGIIACLNEVVSAATDYPLGVLVVAFVCLVIGVAISYSFGLKDFRLKKLEYKREDDEKKARADAEAEKRLRSNIRTFKEEPCAIKKAMAAEVYKQKDHRMSVNIIGKTEIERMENNYGGCNAWHPFFIFDARGEDYWYVELIGWVIELFDAKPDLVHEFPVETKGQCKEILEMCAPE